MSLQEYLTPGVVPKEAHGEKAKAFLAGQKDRIDRCIRTFHPDRVVFLGAGLFNDIPIETTIAEGAEVFCVDWMHEVMERAYMERVVQVIQDRLACVICQTTGNPRAYCLNYLENATAVGDEAGAGGRDLCDNFVRSSASFPLCENFEAGEFPRFVVSDVTQGYSAHFAEGAEAILAHAGKPRQAVKQVIRRAKRPWARETLPIEDGTVDLVTSSMVASQFDFEPFTYFIRELVRTYGMEKVRRAARDLSVLEEDLRDTLLVAQMQGHCEEMVRLLRPDGRVYFSMEILHQPGDGGNWFQPKIVPKILDVLNRFFFYDVDSLPDLLTTETRDSPLGGRSVIQSSLLKPIGSA